MSDQPNCPKCEACGSRGPSIVLTLVRTTNGSLFWCEQCRDDINRKNPRVAELERELAAAKKCVTCFKPEYLTQGLPPESEFAVRCIEYRKQLYGCDGPGEEAYAAEIARLRAELAAAREEIARLQAIHFVEPPHCVMCQPRVCKPCADRMEKSVAQIERGETVPLKEVIKTIECEEIERLTAELSTAQEENAAMVKQLNDHDLRNEQRHREWDAELTEQRRINAELVERVKQLESRIEPEPFDPYRVG